MILEYLPAPDVLVTVVAPVSKLCPVKDETDEGTVTIRYRTNGKAIELHSLAAFLASFAGQRLSHEDFTARVTEQLGTDVTSTWTTAGMEVTCALPGESLRTSSGGSDA